MNLTNDIDNSWDDDETSFTPRYAGFNQLVTTTEEGNSVLNYVK